jgi:hypothetical protein
MITFKALNKFDFHSTLQCKYIMLLAENRMHPTNTISDEKLNFQSRYGAFFIPFILEKPYFKACSKHTKPKDVNRKFYKGYFPRRQIQVE